MNSSQLRSAFGAICLAIHSPNKRKPKSILHATRGYRKCIFSKPRHIEELQTMTLQEVFDLSYELAAQEEE